MIHWNYESNNKTGQHGKKTSFFKILLKKNVSPQNILETYKSIFQSFLVQYSHPEENG